MQMSAIPVIPAKVHRHPNESWDLMTLALDSKDSCIRRNDGVLALSSKDSCLRRNDEAKIHLRWV